MKELNLSDFTTVDKATWENLAQKQLKGADPKEELSWENEAGINLEGYYDQSDIQDLQYLEDFFSNLKPHNWKLYQRVIVAESKNPSAEALASLMGGCDGVIFDLKNAAIPDNLLNDIDSQICDLSFINDSHQTPHVDSNTLTDSNCIFEKQTHISPITQLSELIAAIDANHSYVHRTAFKDFFLEIASIRALKFLLSQRASEVSIHSQIPAHESDEHQWFLNTTAGLASILGGSHSIDLFTAIGDPRISRNTGNLIREESGINTYTDQCGGSYYVEVLTDKIIKGVTENLK